MTNETAGTTESTTDGGKGAKGSTAKGGKEKGGTAKGGKGKGKLGGQGSEEDIMDILLLAKVCVYACVYLQICQFGV